MDGETKNAREAIDRTAQRIVDVSRNTSTPINHEQARKRVLESARRHDRLRKHK